MRIHLDANQRFTLRDPGTLSYSVNNAAIPSPPLESLVRDGAPSSE
jgi:hypothetical protein